MRRNVATLIKYALLAALFVLVGPVLLKLLLAGSKTSNKYVRSHMGAMPEPPVVHDKKHSLGELLNFEVKRTHAAAVRNSPISKDNHKVF